MKLTPNWRSLLQMSAVLAVLATGGVLAVITTVLSGAILYGIVMAITSATAVAGGIALSSNPSNLVPHIVMIFAGLGLLVAMSVTQSWGSTKANGIFGSIIGGGALGAGINTINAKA